MTVDREEEDLPRTRLSEDLEALRLQAQEGGMTILELEQALRGRGIVVLVLLMGLPFSLPVSIPGVSTPFGIAMALIGYRLALGGRPLLPGFVQKVHLNPVRLQKLLGAGVKFALRIEKIAKPRWAHCWRTAATPRLLWFLVGTSGLLLSLPILLPFTNTFPGIAIVLLCIAIMEQDGIFAMSGMIAFFLGLTYFVILGYLFPAVMAKAFAFAVDGYEWLRDWFQGLTAAFHLG